VEARRAGDTVAYLSTSDGADSLNFGFNTLSSFTFNRTKVMKITNTSNAPVTYTFAAHFTGPAHGATVTFTPSSVTVKARTPRSVSVRMRILSASLPALPNAEASDFGSLVSIRGLVTATPTVPGPGIYPLVMGFSMTPKALSNVTAPTHVSGSHG